MEPDDSWLRDAIAEEALFGSPQEPYFVLQMFKQTHLKSLRQKTLRLKSLRLKSLRQEEPYPRHETMDSRTEILILRAEDFE